MCILMNSASSSSDCDDDCAELSANLCEKEQTDIVQSHIRETTHSDLQREKPVLAGSARRRCQWSPTRGGEPRSVSPRLEIDVLSSTPL